MFPEDPYRIEDRAGKELQEALPHGGKVDRPMLCWPGGFDFIIDLSQYDQFVSSPHVHPLP